MKRHLLSRIFVTVGALALSSGAFAGKPLFIGQAQTSAANTRIAQGIAHRRESANVRVMRTDTTAVSADTRELDLDLGLVNVTAVLDKVQASPGGSLIWIGHLKGGAARTRPLINKEVRRDEQNAAILVRRGNGVTGSVRVKGRLYRIEPMGDGNHAVIEVDESALPAEHPDSYRTLFDQAMRQRRGTTNTLDAGIATAPGATQTIRVMVVASQEAVANYQGDMQALAELAVAESNTGYANSNVGITMELAGYYASNYAESGSFDTDLSRFSGTNDGFLDNYHATRNTIAADVNVLIVDNGDYCGLGYLNSGAANAFSVVSHSCATGYYSFAHEIGHNMGAHHDPANGNNTTYTYGHGYQYGNSWRTIMAYSCPQSCPRLNYWSSPEISYNGVAMGNANQSDNRRVLIERKATVAAFRGAVAPNNPPVANFTFTTSNLTANFTDSSTDNDGNIATRSWDFGDGTSATTANPSKTYTAAGTYNVKLTVTDDDGASHNVTKSVTVTAAPVGNVLTKGVAKTGLSAATGAYAKFTMVVPAGATNLAFTLSGGTGDADMYVKFGSEPTDSVYDCRPYKDGNAETCTFAAPQAGTYYINLKGYSAFSGVSLVGDYSTGGSGTQTYSNTADYTISDNATVDSPITVSGRSGNAPSNASVTVAIVHTYQGDLKVDLVAPGGTLYNIHNRTGSSADNINKTVTLNLSSEALNGTWKLRVNDNAGGDTGRIDSWSITF